MEGESSDEAGDPASALGLPARDAGSSAHQVDEPTRDVASGARSKDEPVSDAGRTASLTGRSVSDAAASARHEGLSAYRRERNRARLILFLFGVAVVTFLVWLFDLRQELPPGVHPMIDEPIIMRLFEGPNVASPPPQRKPDAGALP
jgi:hypothetical protein